MKEMQKQPTMMTVREIAGTGLMSEHALRMMLDCQLKIGQKLFSRNGKL